MSDFADRMERKLDLIDEWSTECNAPDCETIAEYPREYCSTVCMNVGLEVSELAIQSAVKHGSITKMEDIPDETVAEIRGRNQKSFDRINKKLEEQ